VIQLDFIGLARTFLISGGEVVAAYPVLGWSIVWSSPRRKLPLG
jgi:hypothetical protein